MYFLTSSEAKFRCKKNKSDMFFTKIYCIDMHGETNASSFIYSK